MDKSTSNLRETINPDLKDKRPCNDRPSTRRGFVSICEYNLSKESNSLDPYQTAPGGAV